MKHFLNAFLLAVFLGVAPAAVADIPSFRIVVYGDSLTSGHQIQAQAAFPAQLEQKLKEIGYTTVQVFNMSMAGETSAGGVDRLDSLLTAQPDIVILELGANDVLRGASPAAINGNLGTILSKLSEKRIYSILMGVKAPVSLGASYGKQIESMYERLADYYRIALYPNTLEGTTGHPELNLADGYHPNSKGVEVMVEGMYRTVDAVIRQKWEEKQYLESQHNQRSQQPLPMPTPPSVGR